MVFNTGQITLVHFFTKKKFNISLNRANIIQIMANVIHKNQAKAFSTLHLIKLKRKL